MGTLDTLLVSMMKFSQAASHEDFPEGGMRMAGELPNTYDDSIGVYGGSSYTASIAASVGTPGGAIGFPISPTAGQVTTAWAPHNMFGTNSPLSAIAQYFRRWRFRELALVYEGTCSTATAGSVQVTWDPDLASAANRVARTNTQTSIATSRGARFPAWTARAIVPLIVNGSRSSIGDFLFSTTGADVSVSSATNGTYNTLYQGAVMVTNDQASAASGATWGRYRWRFVLDLYGLTNYVADGSLSLEKKEVVTRTLPQQRQEELKAESSDSELVELQPIPFVRSGNSAVSTAKDLSFTPANTPAGSQTRVKTSSQK